MFTVVLLLIMLETGELTLAEAGALAVALRLLSIRGRQVTMGIGGLLEAHLFLEDLDEFAQLGRRHTDRMRERAAAPAPETISLRGVSYTYPSAQGPSLHGVDLTLHRGETIALVGENGSGKTTLAKLLAALHAPSEGVLTWNGIDADEFDPSTMRRHVGVVFQDFMRYQLPARLNISLGRPERDAHLDDVRQAARAAGVDGLLNALPRGYDTILSKAFHEGRELSIGQWQRLALARVFFRDSGVIILDEPTAALDPRAEHDLFLHVRDLLADRTVVLISHRFSSVRMADRIYVLEAGAIIEAGTHEQLMRQAGQYAELFTLQAQAYLTGGSGGRS
jgi:ATP-binding cassette subfamily B protein